MSTSKKPTKTAAYCQECGTKFSARGKYCSNCGHSRGLSQKDVHALNQKNQISTSAIWILMLLSAGLFSVYWLYKQWGQVKQLLDLRVSPVLRAIFGIFFIPSLFNRISDAAEEKTYGESSAYSVLFILLIIFQNIAFAVMGDAEMKTLGLTFVIFTIAAMAAIMSLMQKMMNKVWNTAQKPVVAPLNKVVVGILLIFGFFIWLGAFLPPEPISDATVY